MGAVSDPAEASPGGLSFLVGARRQALALRLPEVPRRPLTPLVSGCPSGVKGLARAWKVAASRAPVDPRPGGSVRPLVRCTGDAVALD